MLASRKHAQRATWQVRIPVAVLREPLDPVLSPQSFVLKSPAELVPPPLQNG